MNVILFSGQGGQHKGMGKILFKKYLRETKLASEILGYDVEELCVADPKRQLGKTAFTQPAVFLVNALQYYERKLNCKPYFFLGHSLGEFNALLAAGVFDFETGLRLVEKRALLMSAVPEGRMAVILNVDVQVLEQMVFAGGYKTIAVANYNTDLQTVISGEREEIDQVINDFEDLGIDIFPLFVGAPCHTPAMLPIADEFASFLSMFSFEPPKGVVIANATALPYEADKVADLLCKQLVMPVQWKRSIQYLLEKGISSFDEIGGKALTKMLSEIISDGKTKKYENSLKKL